MIAADTKYGSLKWTCDQFRDYWDNLHAIALTLERLRLADLYGVTKRGEQYSGWKMLPGPITATQSGAMRVMTMEDAARFVSQCTAGAFSAAQLLKDKSAWQQAYRIAVKDIHPDMAGQQSDGGWDKLQEAAQLLNSLHNRK